MNKQQINYLTDKLRRQASGVIHNRNMATSTAINNMVRTSLFKAGFSVPADTKYHSLIKTVWSDELKAKAAEMEAADKAFEKAVNSELNNVIDYINLSDSDAMSILESFNAKIEELNK